MNKKNPYTTVDLRKGEYPPVRVRAVYPEDSTLDEWPITAIGLSNRAENAAKRVGLMTIGDVLDNWDKLLELRPRMLDPTRDGKGQGIGMATAVELRVAVFVILCSETQVKLGINTGRIWA